MTKTAVFPIKGVVTASSGDGAIFANGLQSV